MPSHFDLDDIYVVVSEEALFAADATAQRLKVSTQSSLFERMAIECGRALKEFFEIDHEMGLTARQKIVRGMMERTPPNNTYFETISNTFMKRIETQDPSLFAILNSCIPLEEVKNLAHIFFLESEQPPILLRGPWVDPSNAVGALIHLQQAARSLMYLQQCSLNKKLQDLYTVHTPTKNADPDTQKKEVYRTLYPKYPEDAQLFHTAIEQLEKSHPDVAKVLLQRFYFMDFQSNELGKDFHHSLVLNAEQNQLLEQAVGKLNAQWKNTPIAEQFCTLWVNDAVKRARHIMEGIGQQNNVLVAVDTKGLDKDKIEQRRADVTQTVRRSLGRST